MMNASNLSPTEVSEWPDHPSRCWEKENKKRGVVSFVSTRWCYSTASRWGWIRVRVRRRSMILKTSLLNSLSLVEVLHNKAALIAVFWWLKSLTWWFRFNQLHTTTFQSYWFFFKTLNSTHETVQTCSFNCTGCSLKCKWKVSSPAVQTTKFTFHILTTNTSCATVYTADLFWASHQRKYYFAFTNKGDYKVCRS